MENKKTLDAVINERLSSSDWDALVARRVIKHKRRMFALVSGVAGFAAAASLAIVLNFTVMQTQETESFDFIAAQLDGSLKQADLATAADIDIFSFEE